MRIGQVASPAKDGFNSQTGVIPGRIVVAKCLAGGHERDEEPSRVLDSIQAMVGDVGNQGIQQCLRQAVVLGVHGGAKCPCQAIDGERVLPKPAAKVE